MARRVFRLTFGGVLAVALMACGQKDAEFEPTYYRDVQPILEARCNACHQAGDIGPFTFETYDDASRYADMIAAAVESKTMPPLPAEIEGCRDFVDERIMTAEERETLRMWAKQGAAPGDSVPGVSQSALTNFGPEDIGPPTSTHDMGVDYETSPDNPQASSLDEYRCFVVDPGWAEAKHLKAVGFVPDNRQVVHHGIIYLDLPNSHEDVDVLEAADAAPGYNCFGGAGFDNAILLAGYAPGAKTKAFPDGATITLPRGSRFVVQLHYNFLNTFHGMTGQ